MSELDNLSNDELRIELLKYGFANMPVTQTTRKVLLKKLKIAMESQKSKTRRETVAVMKASDDEMPVEASRGKKEKTPNRRATVAAVERTKKVPATTTTQNGSDSPPKIQKQPSRRSSRATPAKDKPFVSSSATSLQEQSDDDVIEVNDSPINRRSKSKTPTLGKSETVRTSTHYIRSVPIVREEDPSTEEDERSYQVEFQEPKPQITRRTATSNFSSKPTAFKSSAKVLSTSYNPSYSYTRMENEYEDEEEENADINAPYLSDFAKRLSTLRAEPLDTGVKKYEQQDVYYNQVSQPSTTYRYSTSQYSKPMTSSARPNTGVSLAKKLNQMDKKFSISKYVYICLIIMLLVAVYVIFFT